MKTVLTMLIEKRCQSVGFVVQGKKKGDSQGAAFCLFKVVNFI